MLKGFDCYYFEDVARLKGFGSKNQMSLPELVVRQRSPWPIRC